MKRERKSEKFNMYAFLEKFEAENEEFLSLIIRRVLFVLLIAVEGLILLQQIGVSNETGNYKELFVVVSLEILLTAVDAVKLFWIKEEKDKTVCYIVDVLAVFLLTSVVGNAYLCPLYVLLLTEFYIRSKMFPSIMVCGICVFLFTATFWGTAALHQEKISVISSVTQSFTDFIVIFVHFAIVNAALRFYRQYLKLKKTLKELDANKEKLQKANEELAAAAALEERQRIAKDIHDTAGHSITTVIMQTEAAKLIIDKNPEEAKAKIIAANLQAKHALEELRDSVHLLSGNREKETLAFALGGIIRESTDGTGIRIRSEIDDLSVTDEQHRFLCNSLKEGISNGLRHGRATAFWFELKGEGNTISFLLSDNGRGADETEFQKGFGLSSMEATAKKLGGKTEIYTEEGEGFEIRIELPVAGRTNV